MKVRRICAACSAGLLVVALAGCGKVADKVAKKGVEKGIEKSTGASIDSNGNGITIKDKNGNEYSAGQANSLPEGWPKDILPVPDGFKIVGSTKLKQSDGMSRSVSAQGKGDPEKIVASYKKRLTSAGYEIQTESQIGGMNSIAAKKGNTNVSVGAVGDSGSSDITVTMNVIETASSSN